MEILIRKTGVLCLSLGLTFLAVGQTQEELQTGFASSYKLEKQKEYSQAIAALTKVHSSTNYETSLRLGWLYYLHGDYLKSTEYYSNASKLMPVATEPLWGMIYPYSALKKWVKVEEVYKSILKLDRDNSAANYHLGLIYYYRKNYTLASSHFSISLNQNPFDRDALLMSAWTYYFLGKYNQAKALFQKVLLNNPGDTSALEGLGMIK